MVGCLTFLGHFEDWMKTMKSLPQKYVHTHTNKISHAVSVSPLKSRYQTPPSEQPRGDPPPGLKLQRLHSGPPLAPPSSAGQGVRKADTWSSCAPFWVSLPGAWDPCFVAQTVPSPLPRPACYLSPDSSSPGRILPPTCGSRGPWVGKGGGATRCARGPQEKQQSPRRCPHPIPCECVA